MFCSRCGQDLPDRAQFCDACGADPRPGTPGPGGAGSDRPAAGPSSLLQRGRLIGILGAVIVLAIVGVAFLFLGGGDDAEQPEAASTVARGTGTPQPASTTTPLPTVSAAVSPTVAASASATVDASASEVPRSPATGATTTTPAATAEATTAPATTAPTTRPATIAAATAPATSAPTTPPATPAPPTSSATSAPSTPTPPAPAAAASVGGQVYYDGAPCAGCRIWIVDTAGDEDYETMSDAGGFYAFPSIAPGAYTVFFNCEDTGWAWYMDDVPFDAGENGYFIDMPECL